MEKASLLAMMAALALLAAATGCSGPSSLLGSSQPLPPVVATGEPNSYKQNLVAVGPAGQQPQGRLARWKDKVTSVFKRSDSQTPDAMADPGDPISLANKPKASPALLVSLAHLHERSGNQSAAMEQYERALAKDPNYMGALLGLARLHDRQENFKEATDMYVRATQAEPGNAAVYNDLGLCYARQGQRLHEAAAAKEKLRQAAAAMEKAASLAPSRKLYRNNASTVLVELNQPEQAFLHLADVHPPAVANYNVGYLLAQKELNAGAGHYFAKALELDPNMADARNWLDILKAKSPAAAAGPRTAAPQPRYDQVGPRYGEKR